MTSRTVLVSLILGCVCLTPALAGGDVNLFFGKKQLDSALEPLDDPTELGLLVTFHQPDWPVALAADLLYSSEDATESVTDTEFSGESKLDLEIWEIDLGVRRYFGQGRLQGYAGGGLAYVGAEESLTLTGTLTILGNSESVSASASSSERAFGFWLNGGAVYRIGARVNVGLDLRYSSASVTFEGNTESTDVGGFHYGLFVGFHWGS